MRVWSKAIAILVLCVVGAGCAEQGKGKGKKARLTLPAIQNPAHSARIIGLAISPSGKMVATGALDGKVTIWFQEGEPKSLDLHAREVWSLSFSPDESQLFVGADDCIALLDTDDLNVLWRKNSKVLSRNVAFSDDGKLVAVVKGVEDPPIARQQVEVCAVEDGDLRTRLECDRAIDDYVSFLSDGDQIVAAGRGGVCLWDTDSGKLVSELAVNGGGGFALSPEENIVAAGNFKDTVTLLDLRNGEMLHRLNFCDCEAGGYSQYPIEFSPDGKLLATGYGGVWLWDAVTGMPLTRFTDELTCSLRFSPDGMTLVSGQNNGWVKKWDVSQFIPNPDVPRDVPLSVEDVLLEQGEGTWQQPSGLVAVDARRAQDFPDLAALYTAALTDGESIGQDLLLGRSHIFCHRLGDEFRATVAEVLEYVRRGNHILVRVKYVLNYAYRNEYWYVKIRLPVLEPGRYRATIMFDEYSEGEYVGPAADTVFTEFEVK